MHGRDTFNLNIVLNRAAFSYRLRTERTSEFPFEFPKTELKFVAYRHFTVSYNTKISKPTNEHTTFSEHILRYYFSIGFLFPMFDVFISLSVPTGEQMILSIGVRTCYEISFHYGEVQVYFVQKHPCFHNKIKVDPNYRISAERKKSLSSRNKRARMEQH